MRHWFAQDARRRRWLGALLLYAVSTLVFFVFAKPERLTLHTPYNHFALLAESWLQGRLDLGGPPPAYAGMNDFAQFGDRWYIPFPPFPAVLMLPWVWLAGSAAGVRDGQVFLWLAGVAPAALFLALEKLSRLSLSARSTLENLALAALFAFGSVYFFTAEQGTVWFAAHVVGAGLFALFLLFAIDAERPFLAGLVLGLAFLTRTPLIFAAVLFGLEALRVCSRPEPGPPPALASPEGELSVAQEPLRSEAARSESTGKRVAAWWAALDKRRLLVLCAQFSAPLLICVGIAMWHNYARFGSVSEVGYRFLKVRWAARMERWGLFNYHYLARNLGMLLTGLPYVSKGGLVPFQINLHGLALWFTTPIYLWLLAPAKLVSADARQLRRGLWIAVGCVAIWTLLYQNTGWQQFGQRFSNDYAPLLFVLLAINGQRFGWLFRAACVWAIVVNGFGAWTFDKPQYRGYYVFNPSEYYQPD